MDLGRHTHRWLLVLVLVQACGHSSRSRPAASAVPSGTAAFSRHELYSEAKISPKGTYVAAVTNEGGKRSLAFIRLETREITFVLRPASRSMVGRFFWANDERAVVETWVQEGDLATPKSYGELYAVDASGGNARLIFGYRAGEMQTGSHLRKAEASWAHASVLDTLPDDERKILIETETWEEAGEPKAKLFALDVYSGLKELVAVGPMPGAEFLTDERGELRVAVGLTPSLEQRVFLRDEDTRGWRELSLPSLGGRSEPVFFSAAKNRLFLVVDGEEGFSVVALDVATGAPEVVARTTVAPPAGYLLDLKTHELVGLELEPDLPAYEIVLPAHPLARVVSGMRQAFPGERVGIVSATDDQRQVVMHVSSDRNPGQYLLVDVETLVATPIVSARPWLRPESMAATSAFHVSASDGLTVHGYLTSPAAAAATPPPLVVLPHGGPHGVRDWWRFDPEVQLLASHGFAVLQVNYRGSDGYGVEYREAGYRRWGDRVQDDIIDVTRWVVKKGLADPQRICIYGASFGAYAAMESAIRAPDLFRCAAGYAGIYDLGLMMDLGDIREKDSGRAYLQKVLGNDVAALRAASPVHNPDELRVPVLLIHGAKDQRAPVEHAKLLREALTRGGRAPEWLLEPTEGHGFYDEAARERMYEKLVEFLVEHTRPEASGARAEASGARPEASP